MSYNGNNVTSRCPVSVYCGAFISYYRCYSSSQICVVLMIDWRMIGGLSITAACHLIVNRSIESDLNVSGVWRSS